MRGSRDWSRVLGWVCGIAFVLLIIYEWGKVVQSDPVYFDMG